LWRDGQQGDRFAREQGRGRDPARRECIDCTRRFTTYEHIEEIPIMIVKKDGRREIFNREKVRSGMRKACQKLDISMNAIEDFIDDLERDLRETGEKEIPSREVGEKVMAKLHTSATSLTCASRRCTGSSRM
jgi:transcriptional regulator NrdR